MLVILYIVYILVMYFNRYLESKITKFAKGLLQKCRKTDTLENGIVVSDEKQPLSGEEVHGQSFSLQAKPLLETFLIKILKEIIKCCLTKRTSKLKANMHHSAKVRFYLV